MDIVTHLFEFILHIDTHLTEIVREYGGWAYGILFLIVFCETGLVITPFLPGDSLLFAAGTLAAGGGLQLIPVFSVLLIAAIVGDSVNYAIGSYFGLHAFRPGNRVLKPKYLERTQAFYVKHGGKTIILARFVPIVRTYAPFVAGAGKMRYSEFLLYNVVGGLIWVTLFTLGGYLFGNIPVVQENFGLVIIGIIVLSVVPMIVEIVRHRRTGPSAEATP
jgi:membrane-associated protein